MQETELLIMLQMSICICFTLDIMLRFCQEFLSEAIGLKHDHLQNMQKCHSSVQCLLQRLTDLRQNRPLQLSRMQQSLNETSSLLSNIAKLLEDVNCDLLWQWLIDQLSSHPILLSFCQSSAAHIRLKLYSFVKIAFNATTVDQIQCLRRYQDLISSLSDHPSEKQIQTLDQLQMQIYSFSPHSQIKLFNQITQNFLRVLYDLQRKVTAQFHQTILQISSKELIKQIPISTYQHENDYWELPIASKIQEDNILRNNEQRSRNIFKTSTLTEGNRHYNEFQKSELLLRKTDNEFAKSYLRRINSNQTHVNFGSQFSRYEDKRSMLDQITKSSFVKVGLSRRKDSPRSRLYAPY